ncbi:hypothetical protein BDZ97DRAFT_1757880 [Flammula alnicola]|nr:hypothetical protein BDZ97DRAFT_1757880 [Flammula alnicola]
MTHPLPYVLITRVEPAVHTHSWRNLLSKVECACIACHGVGMGSTDVMSDCGNLLGGDDVRGTRMTLRRLVSETISTATLRKKMTEKLPVPSPSTSSPAVARFLSISVAELAVQSSTRATVAFRGLCLPSSDVSTQERITATYLWPGVVWIRSFAGSTASASERSIIPALGCHPIFGIGVAGLILPSISDWPACMNDLLRSTAAPDNSPMFAGAFEALWAIFLKVTGGQHISGKSSFISGSLIKQLIGPKQLHPAAHGYQSWPYSLLEFMYDCDSAYACNVDMPIRSSLNVSSFSVFCHDFFLLIGDVKVLKWEVLTKSVNVNSGVPRAKMATVPATDAIPMDKRIEARNMEADPFEFPISVEEQSCKS